MLLKGDPVGHHEWEWRPDQGDSIKPAGFAQAPRVPQDSGANTTIDERVHSKDTAPDAPVKPLRDGKRGQPNAHEQRCGKEP